MFAETTVSRGHVSHGADSAAYVRFHKFTEKGVTKDFVEIIFPGDNKTTTDRQVKEDDKNRWPKAWEAYQKGEEYKMQGYALEAWPEVDAGMVRDLNHLHIYTVEQLSQVTDQNMGNLGMGARSLIAKAKAFVEVRKDTEQAMKMAGMFEQMKDELELLRSDNKDLARRLQAFEDSKDEAPRRGRPPRADS